MSLEVSMSNRKWLDYSKHILDKIEYSRFCFYIDILMSTKNIIVISVLALKSLLNNSDATLLCTLKET